MRARPQSRVLSMPLLLPAAFGAIMLAGVGYLVWHDITVWSKDLNLIFFGSRIGEAISLGIGMRVIDYFLIGLALLFLGSIAVLRRRKRVRNPLINNQPKQPKKKIAVSGCSHDFGYLGSLNGYEAVPQECLTCQKMLECRNPPPR